MNEAYAWLVVWAVGQAPAAPPAYSWNPEPVPAAGSPRATEAAPPGYPAGTYAAETLPSSRTPRSAYAGERTARSNDAYSNTPNPRTSEAFAGDRNPRAATSYGSASSGTQAAAYETPAAPSHRLAAATPVTAPAGGGRPAPVPRETAADLAARYFHPSAADDTAAVPLSLEEALSKGDSGRNLQVVQTYWRLAMATAQIGQRQREQERLETVADLVGRQQPEARNAALLFAAFKAGQAGLKEDEAVAGRLQRDLADLVRRSTRENPIPVDLPHVGNYQTHFERIYPDGNAPSQAVALHRTLPIRRQSIDARAAALRAADGLAAAVMEDYAAGKGTLAAVLAAERELAVQERAFLRAICEYNLDIAEYALPLAPPNASAATVTGMLIKTQSGSKAEVSRRTGGSPHSVARPQAVAKTGRPRG